jgi:HlyD family secretion protein
MRKPLFSLMGGFLLFFVLTACEKNDPSRVQGYVEGEFVYVASPFGGQLQTLSVERGDQVKKDDPLFTLEDTSEKAARDQAERRVAQAQASLADVRQGQRPSEIQSIQAQLDQAKAALILSQRELERQSKLFKSSVAAQRDEDVARAQRDQDQQRVAQLTATLETAQLGARSEQVVAAEENLRAQQAALNGMEWNLSQKQQNAPLSALVTDNLYRPGDWVTAGSPVVVLLPPANIKVRAFISQGILGRVRVGDRAQVIVDGVAQPYEGRVKYISPRAEYTPPVIYSQKMREKFVFMIKLSFRPEVAEKLHPGQPVDVQLTLAAP